MTKVYDGSKALDTVVITAGDNAGFSLTVTGGDLPEGYRIEFTPTISGSDVGNYVVTVDALAVKVYDADSNVISGYNTLVESYEMSITPATVTVYPTFTKTDKVYGDMDSAYGIGFAIQFAYGYIASATTFSITPFVLLTLGLGVIGATVATLKTLKKH